MFLFGKHLRNESVFEMKVKFFVFETFFVFLKKMPDTKCFQSLNVVGCRGVSASPKVLVCQNFAQNSQKIGYRNFDT